MTEIKSAAEITGDTVINLPITINAVDQVLRALSKQSIEEAGPLYEQIQQIAQNQVALLRKGPGEAPKPNRKARRTQAAKGKKNGGADPKP